jgi:hypothetical protein
VRWWGRVFLAGRIESNLRGKAVVPSIEVHRKQLHPVVGLFDLVVGVYVGDDLALQSATQ